MIWRLHFLILTMLLAILPGCADLRNLEDVTLALMAGIDLSEKMSSCSTYQVLYSAKTRKRR